MTGLRRGQLTELAARVAAATGDVVKPGGSPGVIGLYKSVAMVVTLMRTNITQEIAGDIFGCSQATVSRRWDLLRPAIGGVLTGCIPDPRQILGGRYDVTVRAVSDDGHPLPDPAAFAAAARRAASSMNASVISAHTAEETICVVGVAAPDRPSAVAVALAVVAGALNAEDLVRSPSR
jgi:hypothetical protein